MIPSDAFVLLPISRGKAVSQAEKDLRMKELFKASSLVVGLQTDDPFMHIDPNDLMSPTKPIIVIKPGRTEAAARASAWAIGSAKASSAGCAGRGW